MLNVECFSRGPRRMPAAPPSGNQGASGCPAYFCNLPSTLCTLPFLLLPPLKSVHFGPFRSTCLNQRPDPRLGSSATLGANSFPIYCGKLHQIAPNCGKLHLSHPRGGPCRSVGAFRLPVGYQLLAIGYCRQFVSIRVNSWFKFRKVWEGYGRLAKASEGYGGQICPLGEAFGPVGGSAGNPEGRWKLAGGKRQRGPRSDANDSHHPGGVARIFRSAGFRPLQRPSGHGWDRADACVCSRSLDCGNAALGEMRIRSRRREVLSP